MVSLGLYRSLVVSNILSRSLMDPIVPKVPHVLSCSLMLSHALSCSLMLKLQCSFSALCFL